MNAYAGRTVAFTQRGLVLHVDFFRDGLALIWRGQPCQPQVVARFNWRRDCREKQRAVMGRAFEQVGEGK